ncbi:hypothetical protein CHLNCDRAFT_133211 [Chlorella variabilis]|uniref:Vacuolar protein sorting-associated protein 29 n=1 Tax=Chlorella variabilis TaxID=554065 RepID=E1Z2L8_CHLVA|nr:hypothetical protein CHLNCDRAFT_133211 [Chlorella variabilis]EFN60021.1 hypothetical protein CHLNCDRAFT_133211 [Chlorella variabilis]|eukprot:XP_005852123.1 hypothetical protein CHLNCDRAFT_133211 [Chlorella variabilis]
MVLVLCIGHLHLPHRAADLPPKFKSLLGPGKVSHILCPGNLCTEMVSIGDFRIGVCHGHQVVPWGDREALAVLQRKLDCDILVTGHTHRFEAYRHEGRLVISTGSATGAYSAVTPHPTPSFALMDVDGGKATVYVYELVEGQVKVDKLEFAKPQEQGVGVGTRQL